MNFVSFVFVSFFFLCMSVWEKIEWNRKKQTNKQSILEAARRDNEMVIEAFPIWGATIFGHLKTFIPRNRNLLRLARLIFVFVIVKKKTKTITAL